MNYLLGIVASLLLLAVAYQLFFSKMSVVSTEEEEEELARSAEPQSPVLDASYGTEQMQGELYTYPMGEQMGYPSGILPSRVGTFHPTKDCDRFLCSGCWTCSPGGSKDGCAMTDDRSRNYPELIDTIRSSRTNEYPFYRMN